MLSSADFDTFCTVMSHVCVFKGETIYLLSQSGAKKTCVYELFLELLSIALLGLLVHIF